MFMDMGHGGQLSEDPMDWYLIINTNVFYDILISCVVELYW